MRTHTVEIADRSGKTFKIEVSTLRGVGRFRDILAGDREDVDVAMTGLNEIDGKIGHIVLKDTFLGGSWRTLDKGYLRYNSGGVLPRHTTGATTRDAICLGPDRTWGMLLFDYEDGLGVNSEGTGIVIHRWAMGLQDGKFSWVLTDL